MIHSVLYRSRPASLARSSLRRYANVPISSTSLCSRHYCIHSSGQAPSTCTVTNSEANVFFLSKSTIGTARRYATLTELPPSTSSSTPPPFPDTHLKLDRSHSVDVEFEPKVHEETPPIDKYDHLFELAYPSIDHERHIDTQRGNKATLLHTSGASTAQTTLKPKIQAKAAPRIARLNELLVKTALARHAIKSIAEQPFESFRLHHRKNQYRLDYNWHGGEVSDSAPQPHHHSLVSRYDWRLRTPWRTPDEVQKHAYGSKVLFRKRVEPKDMPVSAELEHYQTKYQRFIRLEREESERQALERLHRSTQRDAKGFSTVYSGPVEHLTGLQAVLSVKRRRLHGMSNSAEEAVEEDLDLLQAETTEYMQKEDERSLFLFSRRDRQELPPNTFRRGKMVFIWKCEYDTFHNEWIVPDLQNKSLTLAQLSLIPTRGFVHREWSNQIDIHCEGFAPKPGETYRIDVGYDGTAFDRQMAALEKLANDAAEQRIANDNASKGPSSTTSNIELSGTELRNLLLDHGGAVDTQAPIVRESPVLMQDAYIASWARRYSRVDPLRLDGDPELGLNGTQLRAVANAVLNDFTLIQGPPGTGKTATLVAALKLLKVHFQIAAPILVCAHTNNVVDMIVSKCAEEGLRPLRFGREHRIREDLREYGCEEQIRTHPLQSSLKHWSDEEDSLRDRKKEVLDSLSGKKTVFAELDSDSAKMSMEERQNLKDELDHLESSIQHAHMTYIKTLRRVHADLIASSDVCLATCLSASSWEMGTADFPIVFVDEAGQCDEPTTLIPLMKGARHVVLIGDHKQLPSVCSSDEARSEGLNSSLFERFKRQGCVPSIQLDVQYRMRPEISAFPNKHFYAGSIRDSEERQDVGEKLAHAAVTFYHHTHLETKVGKSFINNGEIDAIICELLHLRKEQSQQGLEDHTIFSKIGVISMYASQAEALRIKVRAALGEDHGIEIHTVDGFQGRDKDTIIISTVRSDSSGQIGFLKDPRRLNVALTRARNRLLVFGNANTLSFPRYWETGDKLMAQYIDWIKESKFFENL